MYELLEMEGSTEILAGSMLLAWMDFEIQDRSLLNLLSVGFVFSLFSILLLRPMLYLRRIQARSFGIAVVEVVVLCYPPEVSTTQGKFMGMARSKCYFPPNSAYTRSAVLKFVYLAMITLTILTQSEVRCLP